MALDILDELATYLAGNGIGTLGTNIKVNILEQDPDDCVALLGRIGLNIMQQRDVADLQFPRFQVLVRAADYNDAADKMQAVRALLHGMINVTLPAAADPEEDDYIRILRCHVEQEGGPIGTDKQGRHEFSANYIVEYHTIIQPTP